MRQRSAQETTGEREKEREQPVATRNQTFVTLYPGNIIRNRYSLPHIKRFVPHNRRNYTSSSSPSSPSSLPSPRVHRGVFIWGPTYSFTVHRLTSFLSRLRIFMAEVMGPRVSLSVEEDEVRAKEMGIRWRGRGGTVEVADGGRGEEEVHRRQTRS